MVCVELSPQAEKVARDRVLIRTLDTGSVPTTVSILRNAPNTFRHGNRKSLLCGCPLYMMCVSKYFCSSFCVSPTIDCNWKRIFGFLASVAAIIVLSSPRCIIHLKTSAISGRQPTGSLYDVPELNPCAHWNSAGWNMISLFCFPGSPAPLAANALF